MDGWYHTNVLQNDDRKTGKEKSVNSSVIIVTINGCRFTSRIHVLFIRKNYLASAWMFRNISSNPALNVFFCLNTCNDNSNPDQVIVLQEKGCPGFVRHVMDVHFIFLLVWLKIY